MTETKDCHEPWRLLGQTWESDLLQAELADWEQASDLEAEDLDEAHRDHRLSLMNPALGLYYFLSDAAGYKRRYGKPQHPGRLVLCRVCMVLGLGPDWAAYAGPLPHGLSATDDFGAVQSKWGPPSRVWAVGARVFKARWCMSELQLDLSFEGTAGALKLVNALPVARAEQKPPAIAGWPTPAQLVDGFGVSVSTLAQRRDFAALDLPAHQEDIARYGEADYTAQAGAELFFQAADSLAQEGVAASGGEEPCLSGVRYRADFDFGSSGHSGPLPWGLDFDDPPAVVLHKVGRAPWQQRMDVLDGYQRWRADFGDLHVLYSLLEDRIYRVTLLARGCES